MLRGEQEGLNMLLGGRRGEGRLRGPVLLHIHVPVRRLPVFIRKTSLQTRSRGLSMNTEVQSGI